MLTFVAIILAYLLGSLSCAIIVSKIGNSPDPRTQGSGNAGATNMLRIGGKKQAAIVLIGDLLKGLIAIWIGYALHVSGMKLGLVGLAAVIGHIFPVYFGFKGGKGVATAIGVVLGLSLISGVLMAASWAAIAFALRYSSLASLIAVILAPVFLVIFAKVGYAIPVICIALLIIWKHKENIVRLQNKTESKIAF